MQIHRTGDPQDCQYLSQVPDRWCRILPSHLSGPPGRSVSTAEDAAEEAVTFDEIERYFNYSLEPLTLF